jgi:hypothetical protein
MTIRHNIWRTSIAAAVLVVSAAVTAAPVAEAGETVNACTVLVPAGTGTRLDGNGLTVPVGTGTASVHLVTVAAWRGHTSLDPRTAFTETLRLEADGVEQSWKFPRAVGASGDLTIAVMATGLRYVATTDDGLRLTRPGVLDACYHNGMWIDTSGRRYPVRARFDSGRILLTVPGSVLATSGYPAILDPKIIVTPQT